jgi:hypothetical protein
MIFEAGREGPKTGILNCDGYNTKQDRRPRINRRVLPLCHLITGIIMLEVIIREQSLLAIFMEKFLGGSFLFCATSWRRRNLKPSRRKNFNKSSLSLVVKV